MCEFMSRVVTLNSDTLIMSKFIVACFAWSAGSSISVKAPPISRGYGILTFLFGIYHDGKILFVKTLEMLLPAVVSGYHRMSWAEVGGRRAYGQVSCEQPNIDKQCQVFQHN